MEAIVPYLFFDGNAKEAFDFYAKALNGEIVYSGTYGEAPTPCPDADKNKIMHATLKAGELTLMCSDAPEGKRDAAKGAAISLSLNFTDDAEMDKVFNAMAEGGNVTMALQDTFWGARFGMLIDKFGMSWMFNHDKPKKN